jgi:hypothetical protein
MSLKQDRQSKMKNRLSWKFFVLKVFKKREFEIIGFILGNSLLSEFGLFSKE